MSNRNFIGIATMAIMSNGPGLWEELQDQAIIERQYDRPFRGFDESRWSNDRWHKVPAFLRDEKGATAIEFGMIAVGLSAIGFVVVQTLLKANGL